MLHALLIASLILQTMLQADSFQEQLSEVTRDLELGKKGVDAAEKALQASLEQI